MKLIIEPIRSWFGFTRRERRSSVILLVIIILIIAVRFIVPEKNISATDVTVSSSDFDETAMTGSGENNSEVHPFPFDPNTASYDTLIKLGLTSMEAGTLISYRNKGGKFRKPSDIGKVYGIEESKVVKLIPFIVLTNDTTFKKNRISYSQKRQKLDINSCDSASLVRLPGIGPVLSARIIKYRRLLGGFVSVNQLNEVYGLSVGTFDLIKERVFADSTSVFRIEINSAGFRELSRLPYFEKYEVTAILKYRELNGKIKGIAELISNKVITKDKADKILPYLKFDE